MSYSTLAYGEHYLAHFGASGWDADQAARAESDATVWIDQRLTMWIRPEWTVAAPPGVTNAHRAYASGLYIRWEAQEADPYSDVPAAKALMDMAADMVQEMVDSGGPVVDGEVLPVAGATTAKSGLNVDIVR